MNTHDIDKLIGINLRRIRAMKGLSQEQLGSLINNSKTKISALENGKEGLGKELMTKICNALNVRPSEFYIEPETPIINSPEELKVITTMRKTPDSKSVLLKISEAYSTETGDTGNGESGDISTENRERKKTA